MTSVDLLFKTSKNGFILLTRSNIQLY